MPLQLRSENQAQSSYSTRLGFEKYEKQLIRVSAGLKRYFVEITRGRDVKRSLSYRVLDILYVLYYVVVLPVARGQMGIDGSIIQARSAAC